MIASKSGEKATKDEGHECTPVGVSSQFPFWQKVRGAVTSHIHYYLTSLLFLLLFEILGQVDVDPVCCGEAKSLFTVSLRTTDDSDGACRRGGSFFQGANSKRLASFFLFQTMSYAHTSGGGNPGTQKWGRGT